MTRLIDADAFRREIDTYPPFDKATQGSNAMANFAKEMLLVAMNNMPTIDAEPVRHGKWIMGRKKRRYGDCEETTWTCSVCGYKRFMTSCPDDKFCKECGAYMKGTEDD